jgi:signal transduction histidine kinase/CHASE1-domain containing sensor protein
MKTELQERADILAINLQRSIDACFEVLRSIAQFYGSSGQVEQPDFQRFVQPTLARHPSIHALEWLPRLRHRERYAFEQTIQAKGYPSFQITERAADGAVVRAGQRSEYFPVLYVEPLANNELVLGFDVASDATRRSALEKARDTGAIVASGRIELVQEAQKQLGFLVILPLYREGGTPLTLSARREQLQGFVLGVFRIADIVRASLPGLELDHIDFYLYDKSDRPGNSFLAAYESKTKQVSASPHQERAGVEFTWRVPTQKRFSVGQAASKSSEKTICTRSFNIADRQWSLLLQPTTAYVDHAELYEQSRLRADAATAQAEKLKQALENLQQTQARWFLEKKLIAVGVGLALLVLGAANLMSYRSMSRLIEGKEQTEQAYGAIAALAKVLSATTDAETNLVDPTLTSTVAEPTVAQQEFVALRQVFATDTEQQRRLHRLEPLVTQRLRLLTTTAPRSPNPAPEAPSVDRQIQQQIRQVIAEMEQAERSRLQYWQQTQYSAQDTFWINVMGVLLSFTLLAGVYYLLQRQMSERQEVEAALFQVNNQLEIEVQEHMAELAQTRELSDLKLRLFSMVSHEFRTPLSTILVSTQSLASGGQDWSEERKAKNLTRIQAAAKTMAQLLNDILMLNRAEAGKLECRPEPLALEPFCRHVIEEIQLSTSAQQPLRFINLADGLEARLDGKLLYSILSNLLSNAVKYSPADSPVQFTLNCTIDSVIFQVQDWGIGIPTEDQPQLYEAFYRGQNVGDVAGTGLGLAVVKTCVDLHGGQITVESQVGLGTTFTVMLSRKG